MFGMYVFSMRGTDATQLSSVTRYTRTILEAIMYIMAIMHVKIINSINTKLIYIGLITCIFCGEIYMFMTHTNWPQFSKNYTRVYDPTSRVWLQEVAEKYQLPQEASYCFLKKEWDVYYIKWLGRYLFDSTDTEVRYIESVEQMEDITADYIVTDDLDNPIIATWINENYPEQAGREVIVR